MHHFLHLCVWKYLQTFLSSDEWAKQSRTEDGLKNIWKFFSGNFCIKFFKNISKIFFAEMSEPSEVEQKKDLKNIWKLISENICIIFFAEMKERSPRSERGRGTEDGLPDYSELCVVRHLPVISNIKYWILKILNEY